MSTLHVENLKGLSSGGNANKIIVPSGQTLDASNGFVAPAGHVIQTVTGTASTVQNSSSSFVQIATATITPSSSSSKILLIAHMHVYVRDYNTNDWRGALIRFKRGSTAIFGDIGADPYGNGAYLEDDSDRYMEYSTRVYLDSPSTTSAVTYPVEGASKGGRVNIDFNNTAYGSCSYYLQEIAG